MAAYPQAYNGAPGDGRGASGPAFAQAQPRVTPLTVPGTNDGPTPQELRAAWRAYNGHFEENNKGPLVEQPGVPDLNILSNRVRPIVNTGVDFLFGPSLAITVEDDVPCQKIIDAVLGDDDLRMTMLSKAAINGGVYGHVFMKVVPPKKGKPSAINPPRLVLLNPETLSVETDPDDADLVLCYRIEYTCTDPDTKGPMRKRQEIRRVDPDGDDDTTATGMDKDTSWTIQDFTASGTTGNNWVPVTEPRPWKYELPPIIDWQNYPNPNSHWGQRDVTDGIVALNRQLRMVESNINKIGFLQGHPIMFSTGTNTQNIRPTPGQIVDLEDINAEIKSVNAAGDLGQLMAFAEQLRADMDEETGIPGMALGRMKDLPRGQISGITMRLLYSTVLARNEHKRRLYGQGIRQACQTILAVCGMPIAKVKELEITLVWQDPLPNDDFNEAQAWQIKVQSLGYSQTTAIENTNGNPEVEQERKQEEQQQQMLAFSHGQGTPPMDAQALAQSAEMNGAEDGENTPPPAPPQSQPQSSNTTASGKKSQPQQMPPVNHPAAQRARARMTAMKGMR